MPPARPTTFARPRPQPAPTAAPCDAPPGRPILSAATAAAFFATCAIAAVSLTGNPKAGSPVVRLSLARIGDISGPAGAAPQAPEEAPGGAPFAAATLELTNAPAPSPADDAPIGGEAIITLSNDPSAGSPEAAPMTALPRAPAAGLFAQGAAGPLPVVSADGRTPAQAYARPFAADGKPKIALVIGGLGLNAKATRAAITSLPPEVTLSFAPFAEGLQSWIDMARAAGHETLIEAPMEPRSSPESDPGQYTLMADAPAAQITQRLDWVLSRATGYFGVANYLGSKFLQSPASVAALESELEKRGLAFIDDGSAARVGGALPRASADRIIDDQLDGGAIAAQLAGLEAQASRTGHALGSGFAYPITLDEAAKWTAGLAQRGYQLTPASALAAPR